MGDLHSGNIILYLLMGNAMKVDIDKIKLVVWDLDETFWDGTISEGEITLIDTNIQIVKKLTGRGIVNSICSKNDYDVIKDKLSSLGIWEYFVFPSISWEPKGQRLSELVKDMGLRNENVIFIDDNFTNLGECKHYCPGIHAVLPEYIEVIENNVNEIGKDDSDHSRLRQYKVLESKRVDISSSSSNEEFLLNSRIKLSCISDCRSEIDRIHELVERTNQLNFTKKRSQKKELLSLFNDESVHCGYVKVTDNYGDYGIVGFYAYRGLSLIHFLFSCRTMGMGIEQYVYEMIGSPEFDVVGEVSGDVISGFVPSWINSGDAQHDNADDSQHNFSLTDKILVKGPCDILGAFNYLQFSDSIDDELTFVDTKTGVTIESYNHTWHIIESRTLDDAQKRAISEELIFADDKMFFNTNLFSGVYKLAYLSLFTDPTLGLYRRESGEIVAFGRYTDDLTDMSIWNDLINHKIYTGNCQFTTEFLEKFKNQYEYIGRISPEQVVSNVRWIRDNMPEGTVLVLSIGAEIEFEGEVSLFRVDQAEYNCRLNELIRDFADTRLDIELLDFSSMVVSQEDYTVDINHFSKQVYHKAANEITRLVNKYSDVEIRKVNKVMSLYKDIYYVITHIKPVIVVGKILKRAYYGAKRSINTD